MIISNMQAKGLFQATAERFGRGRATRVVATRFNVSLAEVRRAAYYWA